MMRAKLKKIIALLLLWSVSGVLEANEKSGAFIGMGGGFAPKMSVNAPNGADSESSLASLHLKYGARHYGNSFFSISLYLPLEIGYGSSGAGSFGGFLAGMGGDVLLDFGRYRGLGLFVGGEMLWAKYWLKSGELSGAQSNLHAGLAFNFSPRLRLQGGVRYTPSSPLYEGARVGNAGGNYGVFVGLVFGIDNSNITREQAVREERYRLIREEENRRASFSSKYKYNYDYGSQGGNAEKSFSSFLDAIFGTGSSTQKP